ncbi:MAG: acyltransferase family protein [Planctomycetia bacterium]
MTQRRTDLDALRGFAMLLGIALHACLCFFPIPWPVHDTRHSDILPLFFVAVHGFRMPLFFLLSGYFTMLVYRRRGLRSLLEQRVHRILLPLVIAVATIMPLDTFLKRFAQGTIRPEPAVAEILAGDEAAVRRRLAAPGAVESKDSIYGRTPLGWAVLHGDPAIVAAVLDAGASPNECDRNGNTALHAAAFLGRDAAARVLLERGTDPRAANAVGRLPLAAAIANPPDVAAEFAPLIGLQPLGVDEVLAGRTRTCTMLPEGPNAEGTEGGTLDRLNLAWLRLLSSEALRVRVGSWSLHLVQTNVFDHLWFLWFLCWLVAIFALLAVTDLLPTGRRRWWFMAASCLLQAVMATTQSFGPETPLGLLPKPHMVGFYACFFFFGVATFAADGLHTRLGRRWKILLPAAAVLLAAGLATMNDRVLSAVLQPAYAWTMSLGLIGLFRRLLPEPRLAVSWLADASYWMYLVHVPLVIAVQMLVREWPLPPGVKFLLILGIVIPILLASYRWCVRYTPIGTLLNGPRDTAPT